FFTGKEIECHTHGHFKKRKIMGIKKWLVACYKFRDKIFRNINTVYFYAFPEILKVRRGVQAGLVTGFLQYRCQHMTYRTLSVGAGNMNGSYLFFRISKMVTEIPDIVQFVFKGCLSLLLVHGKSAEHPLKCLLVCHVVSSN